MDLTPEETALIAEHRAKNKVSTFEPRTYTNEEALEAFSGLYKMAREELEFVRKNKHTSKDFDHYAYEAVIDLLGSGVWEVFNA